MMASYFKTLTYRFGEWWFTIYDLRVLGEVSDQLFKTMLKDVIDLFNGV